MSESDQAPRPSQKAAYPLSFPLELWVRDDQLVYLGSWAFFWGAPLDLPVGLEYIPPPFFGRDLIVLLQKCSTPL